MKQSNADRLGTLLGFLSGTTFILTGILWPAEFSNIALWLESTGDAESFNKYVIQILRFFDLKSFIIVFGGTISATFVAFPYTKTMRSFKSIPKVFSADTAEEATQEIYDQSKLIAEKRYSGKRITNDDISSLANPFMRRWIEGLIVREQVEEESLAQIIHAEVKMYDQRAEEEIEIFDFMGTAAPAFGMVGTIVGLVLMLAETGSIRSVMQAMSIAMLTTLYGVILSNMVLLPIASKRKQLKDSNILLLEMVRESVNRIARREAPYTILQELHNFLPHKRDEFDEQYG
ncbi:MAG: MotA/TolQ/ExbB proton channel family protein [SAR324 cluster bacterium]|nr:MotA/TolQ/ExbB proton channel family protein [SAR324 cluster bacterium]MED5515465.1 MotA/TolQ/ExbB proton channel family protein [SAR324 cluster bacterium]MED6339206.1 MotA/TolQ/ExbB proton channel family protein [SAR324 cluster bacterium]MEE2599284.1 MotA/TolQ/ExbB proton channel family protein [SAR324 cluster bacterium]